MNVVWSVAMDPTSWDQSSTGVIEKPTEPKPMMGAAICAHKFNWERQAVWLAQQTPEMRQLAADFPIPYAIPLKEGTFYAIGYVIHEGTYGVGCINVDPQFLTCAQYQHVLEHGTVAELSWRYILKNLVRH